MVTDMKRNTQNTPGIRKGVKPGSYRIDYYDWDKVRRTKVFHGKHSDAIKLRRSILAKVDRIKNGLESPPSVSEAPRRMGDLYEKFCADYSLKVKSGSIEQSTLDRHMQSIRALFAYNHSLENKLINNVSWRDFEKFKIFRQSKNYSPHGINTNLRSYRTMFNYAVNKEYIKRSPLKDVAYIKTNFHDIRYLSESELSKLHETLNQVDMTNQFQKDAHDLTLFYLYTGARTSEALYPHFNWSCIDEKKLIFPKTKTKVSRSIPLTNSVDSILKTRKHIEEGPFKFDMYQVYKRTTSILKKAEIPNASTHTLRKTAGAYYYIATRDIFATSRFLGHSSVKVTESHYVGLIQSLQKEYSQLFDSILTNNLKKSG